MTIHCGAVRPMVDLLALVGTLAIASGCGMPEATPTPGQQEGEPIPAAALIERMRAAYEALESYAGTAEVVEVAVRRGEGVERELPYYTIGLAYQDPNRIWFLLEELTASPDQTVRFEVASGGELLQAQAAEAPGQVHVAKTPQQLTIDNFLQEPKMKEAVFQVAPENYFPHLVMLLGASGDAPLFAEDTNPRYLPAKRLGPHDCYRVAMDHPAGERILWINQRTKLLERVEVPSDALRAEMDPEGLYAKLAIRVDFTNQRVDTPVDPAVFALETPPAARHVRRFVEPPPEGPPERLGSPIGAIVVTTLDGETVDGEQLRDQTTLLEFWSTTCVPCERELPTVEETFQTLQDEGLACYAVNIDPESVSDEQVRATLEQWGGTMPIVRDVARRMLSQLGVESTPTTLLIDAAGRLQYIHTGRHRSAAPLVDAARAVLRGTDLAAAQRQAHAERVAQYEEDLAAATVDLQELGGE